MPSGVGESPNGGSTSVDIVISSRGHSFNSLRPPPTSTSSVIMGDVVQMHFTTVDYVIFALLLVASAGIGLFYAFSGGRQRTTRVYQIKMTFCRVNFKSPGITTFESVMSHANLLSLPGVPDG